MRKQRNSGIELLKIIAIFMIVISHVTQTLGGGSVTAITYFNSAFIDLTKATIDTETVVLQNLRYLGELGNAIFFICSVWFLCDNEKISLNKIIQILLDVWVISIVYLIITMIMGGNVSGIIIIKSLFPTIFANNWYITFYVIMYAIHPLLNTIINQMNQKSLLQFCIISFCLYFGLGFVIGNLFFASPLITYTVLYFCIAYIKKYNSQYTMNIALNTKILIAMLMANIFLIVFTNMLGLFMAQYVEKMGTQVLRWCSNCNPFLVMIALSLFNIFNGKYFVNKLINYLASLSLLVYALHENIIFREYIRPQVFILIYEQFGYHYILLWVAAFAIILFSGSMIVAALYEKSIQKITKKIANRVSIKFGSLLDK